MAVLAEWRVFEDVEHQQRGDAGTVRRQLEDVPAAIRRRDRIGPSSLEFRKVRRRHGGAAPCQPIDDPPGNVPLVESIAATRGDLPVGPRQIGISENFAQIQRTSSRKKRLFSAGIAAQELRLVVPLFAGDFGNRKAFVRQRYGGIEHFSEWHPAESFDEKRPPANRPRNGDRVHAALRHAMEALTLERLRGQPRRRPSTAIDAVHLPIGLAYDREKVSSNATHHRADHTHYGIGGNGRVDRMASLVQHLRAGA